MITKVIETYQLFEDKNLKLFSINLSWIRKMYNLTLYQLVLLFIVEKKCNITFKMSHTSFLESHINSLKKNK